MVVFGRPHRSSTGSILYLSLYKGYKINKGGNDQESIQSSYTPDLGYHMGKWQKYN